LGHPDLNFHQAMLHSLGIRYLLSDGRANERAPCSPARPAAAEKLTPAPEAVPCTVSTPEADPGPEIPHQLIKYRRPAYCVWSYFKLPLDIQEGFTNPRCELINKIIQSLQWREDTFTLWPLSALKENKLVADTGLFLKGMEVINPVYIFIFGADAHEALFNTSDFVYGSHIYNSHRVIALPDLDSLLPDNRLLKTLVWNMLKQYAPA
jgi:hypothetical protein